MNEKKVKKKFLKKIFLIIFSIYFLTFSTENVCMVLGSTSTPAKIVSLKKNSVTNTKVKLSWKKQSGIWGYEVYQYKSSLKKYTKIRSVKGSNNTSYMVTNLKSQTNYKFYVRGIVYRNGKKIAGLKSSTLKVKTLSNRNATLIKKINSFKTLYPNGTPWTNNNFYYWEANNCYGYGCYAFIAQMSDYLFGESAPVSEHSDLNRVKLGDHIRIGNYHSVLVIQVGSDYVKVAEGNYNESVHWGRKITFQELYQTGFYIDTRY